MPRRLAITSGQHELRPELERRLEIVAAAARVPALDRDPAAHRQHRTGAGSTRRREPRRAPPPRCAAASSSRAARIRFETTPVAVTRAPSATTRCRAGPPGRALGGVDRRDQRGVARTRRSAPSSPASARRARSNRSGSSPPTPGSIRTQSAGRLETEVQLASVGPPERLADDRHPLRPVRLVGEHRHELERDLPIAGALPRFPQPPGTSPDPAACSARPSSSRSATCARDPTSVGTDVPSDSRARGPADLPGPRNGRGRGRASGRVRPPAGAAGAGGDSRVRGAGRSRRAPVRLGRGARGAAVRSVSVAHGSAVGGSGQQVRGDTPGGLPRAGQKPRGVARAPGRARPPASRSATAARISGCRNRSSRESSSNTSAATSSAAASARVLFRDAGEPRR